MKHGWILFVPAEVVKALQRNVTSYWKVKAELELERKLIERKLAEDEGNL